MLRRWLQDTNLVGDRASRERIREITGNWPALLLDLLDRCGKSPHAWEEHAAALEQDLSDPEARRRFLPLFGLDVEEPVRVLRDLQSLVGDEAVVPVALELAEDEFGTSRERSNRALAWAESLHLVRRQDDRWEMDPVVKRLLEKDG
jgi:hypothetical protein